MLSTCIAHPGEKKEREIVIILLHFGQVNWTLSATMEVLFQDEKFRRGKGRMASCSPGHANCLPGERYKGKNGPQGMEHQQRQWVNSLRQRGRESPLVLPFPDPASVRWAAVLFML